jgi:hypothetical protein
VTDAFRARSRSWTGLRSYLAIGCTVGLWMGVAPDHASDAQPRPQRVIMTPNGPMPVDGANGPPGQPAIGPDGQPIPPGQPPMGGAAKPEEAGPKPVVRGDRPAGNGNKQELTIKPGPDGKVQINFHGQKWLDVLEWYADIASLSLDWQEVPGDYLNLRTQRGYTVAEVRDVLNRHLMDRGFTLLRKTSPHFNRTSSPRPHSNSNG